jgi:hypothetical protein
MTSKYDLQEGDQESDQEGDAKKRIKSRLVSVSSGTIGIVSEADVRATHREPSFIGLSRQSLQDRFASATSIPSSGPTVPTTQSPTIQTATPINLQEADQEGDKRMRSPYGKQEGDQEGDAFGDTRSGREGRLVGERRAAKTPFSKQEGDVIGKPKPIKTGFKGPEQGQESEDD